MKATKNIYHINIDEASNWEINLGNGTKLFFDPEFRPDWTAIQWGTIIRPAMSISKRDNMIIPEAGDTVYFHHHVFEQKVEFEEDSFRWASHDNLFFIIRQDEIIMLNDNILIEPIIEKAHETKFGIITESKDKILEQRGTIIALPDKAIELGLSVGQEIVFSKNSDYTFQIEDKDYYMMSYKDILGYVDDKEITPVGDYTIIEPQDEYDGYTKSKSGVFVRYKDNNINRHIGKVYKTAHPNYGIKDGDEVVYDRKSFLAFMLNNKKYYATNTERDILILL